MFPLTVGTSLGDTSGGYHEIRYSQRGHPYQIWRPSLPRVQDVLLNLVAYLYPSVSDAEAGKAAGGCGFIVAVPSSAFPDVRHHYLVTNRHVVRDAPVVRFNTEDGNIETLDLSATDWITSKTDDLAIFPFEPPKEHLVTVLMNDKFMTREWAAKLDLGVGDDVLFVGRFIGYDGTQTNLPAIRFGNISMIPKEPLPTSDGSDQDSILIEARSLPGCSGSPVFFYQQHSLPPSRHLNAQFDLILIGVEWCDLPQWEPVKLPDRKMDCPSGRGVFTNSGMMGVVPSWKLLDFLMEDKRLIEEREKREQRWKKNASKAPRFNSATSQLFTKADFESALRKASRKIEPKK